LPEIPYNVEVDLKSEISEATPGSRLRKARVQKKYSAKQLAEATGISLHTIQDWENDLHSFTPSFLKKVADELEVAPEYILGPLQSDATLGARVKYYRICEGYSQKEFAKILGIDRNILSKIETDKEYDSRIPLNFLGENTRINEK